MNATQSVPMARRVLFLWPAAVVVCVGGIAMAAHAARVVTRRVLQRLRMRPRGADAMAACAAGALWLLLAAVYVMPLVTNGIYEVRQFTYQERAYHKTLERLLAMQARPGDQLWVWQLHTTKWMLSLYMRPSSVIEPRDDMPSREQIGAVTKAGATAWLLNVDPRGRGLAAQECIEVPLYYATLWVVRPGYRDDVQRRAQDAEILLRTLVEIEACPDTNCLQQLAALYLQRGATNQADALVLDIAGASPARAANQFAYEYLVARGDVVRALAVRAANARRHCWAREPQLLAAEAALRAGDVQQAWRCARRAWWLGRDHDGRAAELIGMIYGAQTNRAQAVVWLRRAQRVMAPLAGRNADSARRLRNIETLLAADTSAAPATAPQLLPAAMSLLANGNFAQGLSHWSWWGAAEQHSNQLRVTLDVAGGATAGVLRIENPHALMQGVKQHVPLVSGAVYRLCASARSVTTTSAEALFGGRVALFLPPQPEQQLVWMNDYAAWWPKELVFTNQVTGMAVVYVHLGYGKATTTGEFSAIRLERVAGGE
jgi:hypothetical protein